MRRIAIILFSLLLTGATTYVLLDTFVLEQRQATVRSSVATAETKSTSETTTSSISVTTYRENDTTIYVADIYLGEGQTIQSALADNTYGRNVTDTTSNIASSVDATVAINGDYYGARTSGYVIRNGQLLRATAASDDQEDMVLWDDGSMSIITEGDITAEELLEKGALQVLSFGPGLIIDDEISVTASDEVGKAMASNPRTAIGYLGDNHYVLVVADGRTDESEGLSLLELADFMHDTLGAQQAYNLDGGGSSTIYYDGSVINNPTTNGNRTSERSVSDILYLK